MRTDLCEQFGIDYPIFAFTPSEHVAAVVQPRPGATIELEGLRTFLRAHLSGYKLPRALTIVDEVPRNATGKAQYPKAKEIALATQATATEQDPEGAKA